YLTCFKLLLQRSGPPNQSLRFGATLLHEIVMMGEHVTVDEQLAFAEAAVDAGAQMKARDDLLKSTPLGWACRWGRTAMIQFFLDRGADPLEADAEPWARPAAWAAKMGHSNIAQLLAAHGGTP